VHRSWSAAVILFRLLTSLNKQQGMVDNRKWEPTREGEREKKEKLPEKKKQNKREKKNPV
jgi:hypothetical protein